MILPALMLAVQAPVPAVIPTDPTLFDLRCVAAMTELTEDEDAAAQQAGTAGLLYYLGRLDGRLPGADIAPLINREAEAMAGEDLGAYFKACGDVIDARGQQLAARAQQLDDEAQAR